MTQIEELVNEPLVAVGIGATLQFLKQKGGIDLDTRFGRRTDKGYDEVPSKPEDTSKNTNTTGTKRDRDGREKEKEKEKERERERERDKEKLDPLSEKFKREIRLEYLDDKGRVLTPKEAFRQISHRFHGKRPGKNKLEKRAKQYEEEVKRKLMNETDTPLHAVKALHAAQEKTQSPFILLQGTARTMAAGSSILPEPKPKKTKQENPAATPITNLTPLPKTTESAVKGGLMEGEFKEFKLGKQKK